MSFLRKMLLFAFVVGLCNAVLGAVVKGPYLTYHGDPTQMVVIWQLDAAPECQIKWGTTTSYADGDEVCNAVDDNMYVFPITGLTPGTKYYYQVVDVGTGSFRAASNNNEEITILAYGDTRTNPSEHDKVCKAMVDWYGADEEKQTITLFVGDYVATGRNDGHWATQFFPRSYTNICKFQSEMPLCGVKGNHEILGSGDLLLSKYYPAPGRIGVDDPGEDYYYSFDYGPVHIVAVDQYIDFDFYSEQFDWIIDDIQNTDKDWIIMMYHAPPWTAGTHRWFDENQLKQYPNHRNENEQGWARDYLHKICIDDKELKENTGKKIPLVICGHNHTFAYALKDNVHYITTGGGSRFYTRTR